MQSRGSPWHFLHGNTGLDTTGSFLPAIGKKDQHQLHSAIPKIHSSRDDSKRKSRRSKWYSQQKEIEAELQRELDAIEQAEAALSQLGARKTQPASFGHPRPVPKPRFVKSRIQPDLQPTEAAVPPRWGLSEDLLGKRETPDHNTGRPLPPAASQEDEVHVHAPKEPWQAKALELEQIASEYRWQHEQEKHRREAAMAQDVRQQQKVPHCVDDEQAQQKDQLEERVREIRQREEQRLEEIRQEELCRANQERADAMKRRQEQEDWEKKLRQRIKEEAEQLKTEREKDNLLLQQRAEAMQKQLEEQKERRKQQQEQQHQRQRQQVETQRSQTKAGRGFRMDASYYIPEHAPDSIPKPSFSHGPVPPKMPVPPSPRCAPNARRPQQSCPRPSPHESAGPGASQPGSTARSPCNSASTPKFTSVGGSCGAAAPGSSVDLQAAKAAAMREMLALKKHPGFEARQKGYKELLRAWHPDKNPKNAAVATAVFQMLQTEKGRILDS